MDIEEENPKPKGAEIRREVITIRPTTTTRAAIRITITQRAADNEEVAQASTVISGVIPSYLEKPDLMEDIGRALFVAAHYMRKWNRYAKK